MAEENIQQIPIQVRFVGPSGKELPLGQYVAIRSILFANLNAVAATARKVPDVWAARQKKTGSREVAAFSEETELPVIRQLAADLTALDETRGHIAALGEGPIDVAGVNPGA
jgi:hypothetical protein